ncbi:VTT domain-containing protein [Clostridium sp.]|uniref:TVP38/TMEM64 family protein n=1 Tax=Clostridium sp. TaxID=1506 RepID=UPI0026157E9B|nr:VTT domain-containing protein [Clostridium sp.]
MEDLINIFNTYSEIAIFISLFISIIIALLGVVPSVFVTGANIVFFGTIKGFFISLLGEVIGGWISFVLYKKGTKKLIGIVEGKYKIIIDNILNCEDKKLGLFIFEGRLVPFIPSGVVTLAASMSNVSNLTFIVSTLFGKIPSILIEVTVSYGLIISSKGNLKLGIAIVSIALIYFTIKKVK